MMWLVLAVLLCGCSCGGPSVKVPTSIADALTKRPDEFPPPYWVVVPPIAASALGLAFQEGTVMSGRGQLAAASCFHVDDKASPSLSEQKIEYKASSELAAELQLIAAEAALQVKSDARATLVLNGLIHRRSVSIPNFDACAFGDGKTVKKLITQEVVATSASLDYSRALTSDAKVASEQLKAKLKAGWVAAEQGKLKGSGILLAAKEQLVTVTVETKTLSWPDQAESELPLYFLGNVTIVSYNGGAGRDDPAIKLVINASASKQKLTGIPTCEIGTKGMALARGGVCHLQLDASNSGLYVTWKEVSGKAIVSVRGFRTEF